MNQTAFKYVPAAKLFVSEPDPSHFGNPPNPAPCQNNNWTNKNWLKSRFHFSFAEYHDLSNSQFGVLRVMNDDLVQPKRGFGTHPHSNMEIVTYVIDGYLTHADSKGNMETLGYMTAGKGIQHSEFNGDEENPCRFIQTWILPREKNTATNYSSYKGNEAERQNSWFHIIGDKGSKAAGTINQDANFLVNEFNVEQELLIGNGRQGYLICIEGRFELSGSHGNQVIERHDGSRIIGPNKLVFQPLEKCHVMIVEMQEDS